MIDVLTEKEFSALYMLLKRISESECEKDLERRTDRFSAVLDFLWNSQRISPESYKSYKQRLSIAMRDARKIIKCKRRSI